MDLHDRTFLITGCASGIGRHLAGALLQAGSRVYATDVDGEALTRAAREEGWEYARLITRQLDVRDWEAWHAAIEDLVAQWNRLDVLLNVAGVSFSRRIHEAEKDRIDLHLDVNVRGLIYGARAAAAVMVPQKQGHIINVASIAGMIPVPGMSLYTASKFAVRGFSLAIAEELAQHDVFVTVVCPDAVATPMLDHEALEEEAVLSFAGSRILTVEDLSHAVIKRVLPQRPREIILPLSMSWFARFVTALPNAADFALPWFRRRGIQRQAEYREKIRKF